MLAALAGGTALMGRGRGKVSTAGQPVGVDRMSTNTPPIGGTDHIKKAVAAKAASDAADTASVPIGRMHGAGTDAEAIIAQNKRAQYAQNARKNAAMNYQRSQTFDAKPRLSAVMQGDTRGYRNYGQNLKKGGRVTGIAKRGFGRALMKGKK